MPSNEKSGMKIQQQTKCTVIGMLGVGYHHQAAIDQVSFVVTTKLDKTLPTPKNRLEERRAMKITRASPHKRVHKCVIA